MKHVPVLACGKCGRNPAEGTATIDGVAYCHPDDRMTLTCYDLALLTVERVNPFFEPDTPRSWWCDEHKHDGCAGYFWKAGRAVELDCECRCHEGKPSWRP